MKEFIEELDNDGMLDGIYLCPETMGKLMQIGTVEEIIKLCELNEHLLPTFDFGHINSRTGGSLKTKDDYKKIFTLCKEKLGEERTKNCHIHFSKIEYGAKGEIRHLNFDDMIYGPDFEPLAQCIVEMGLTPHIICESAGHQAEDAQFMKKNYQNTRQNI
jgi:deoxyribonuclease-4